MKTGRAQKPLVLTPEERDQAKALATGRPLPHGLVRRVRIALITNRQD